MENTLCQEALTFTKLLAEQYLVYRKLDALPSVMDEQVSWIGTGVDEIRKNLDEARVALERELEEYSGSFCIVDQWFEVVPLSDTLCIVYGAIQAVPEDGTLSEENVRLTLVLNKTNEGMRFMHLHLSHPDSEQEKGHYFVTKAARTTPVDLRRTLDLRSRQLDILNRNIPGGAHQCKNDPNYTLISMSDSFLSMFGYTREEIQQLFHNNFIEMVYPGDRASLLASAREQLQVGTDMELEYRVLCKNGPPVWVLDKARLLDDGNGGEIFYCLLMEISDRRQAQEELRLSLERHKVIMDQATDIIFEWDIRKDTLSFSPNWRKRFGYDAIDTQISGRIPMSENIHPEDMQAFVQIMRDTAAGVPYSEVEFRIKDMQGRYYWCRIRATAQFDSDGRVIKAVGVIVDIDSEKKQKQMLLEMAQRDTLTGLYNKATINSLVELRMAGRDCAVMQALLILDIDYFKQVNDTYGHLAGDSILSDVAAIIKSQIRNTDLSGRIGGDEFLIYLTEVTTEEAVRAKVETLLKALGKLTPERGAPPISCSVGAAVLPHGGIDFYALYKCADLALYARKNSGRGGMTFYRPGISEKSPSEKSKSAVGADLIKRRNARMESAQTTERTVTR